MSQAVPFARILNIAVNGARRDANVTSDEVKVIRASNDPLSTTTKPGQPGMDLFPLDEVETGHKVNVTIVFLPDPEEAEQTPEKFREVVIDEDTSISISNPQRNKVRVYVGRIVASVWGWFNSAAGSGQAEPKQTDFQLRINADGKVALLVLEGLVTLEKADMEVPPRIGDAAGANHWSSLENFSVLAGKLSDDLRVVTLINPCQEWRSFRIDAPPDLYWIDIEPKANSEHVTMDPRVVKVAPGETKIPVLVTFTTLAPKAATYEDRLSIECIDCYTTCMPVHTVPFRVTVVAGLKIAVPEGQSVKYDPTGPLVPPTPASSKDLRESMELAAHVFEETRLRNAPHLAPQEGIPSFSSTAERDAAFKHATLQAITNTNPVEKAAAYETLGDVYRSVGENEKAAKAYAKVQEYDTTRKNSLAFAIKRLDALRTLGKSATYLETLFKVATDIHDPSVWNTPLFGLGHLSVGTARLDEAIGAMKKGKWNAALAPADKAQRYFEHVLSDKRNLSLLTPQQKSVVWTSYAMVLHTLGDYWLGANDAPRAEESYKGAIVALKNAASYDTANPYVRSNVSLVFTSLGNLEKYKPNPNAKTSLDYYQRAERQLEKLSISDPRLEELQVARIFLQASRGQKVQDWTNSYFKISDALDVLVPKVDGMYKELAAEMIAKTGLIPEFIEDQLTKSSRLCISNRTAIPSYLKKGARIPIAVHDCP